MQQMAGNMGLLNPFVLNQFNQPGAYSPYTQVEETLGHKILPKFSFFAITQRHLKVSNIHFFSVFTIERRPDVTTGSTNASCKSGLHQPNHWTANNKRLVQPSCHLSVWPRSAIFSCVVMWVLSTIFRFFLPGMRKLTHFPSPWL